MIQYLVLSAVLVLAGLLNTVAGGGTFLTFSAFAYAGTLLVTANTTSAVAAFPGYLGGALGFCREIAEIAIMNSNQK